MKENNLLVGSIVSRLVMLAGVASLAFVAEARAGTTGTTLTMTGGAGVAGGTVAATLSLSGSEDEAVSAAVDVLFDGDVLALEFADCAIDPRLEDSHQLGGRVTGDDPDRRLVIDVFVQGTPKVLPPLGDGALVTCDFGIQAGVPTGTTTLELVDPLVADDQGTRIDTDVVDGQIVIGVAPTATPTPTNTPQSSVTSTATATATVTPTGDGGTPTNTPEATATVTPTIEEGTPTNTPEATDTPPATATETPEPTATETEGVEPTATRTNTPGGPQQPGTEDDSCAIVPASQVNPLRSLLLLVGPALLLWGRRRKL
jgi:hypothetical protein